MDLAFVIPAYNEEILIGACLTSVVAEVRRSGYNVEIIVVNNASTDRTKEIASSFESVTVVDEMKKGLVHARRAGFDACTAELVANIDADTELPEGWVTTVMTTFEKRPDLVALSGPYIYHDLAWHKRALVRGFYYFAYILYFLNRFVFRVGSMIQGGNFVLRRTAWDSVGGFDTEIAFYGEDTDVAKRLHKVGPVKWTFKLPMYTSGRRLEEEGVFRTAGTYTLNYLWVTFTGKPFTKSYSDIRPD
ncbi:MAG: glycosyltransferase family 2 protein [Devosiaceae bacterium]|nr:glycosyltransferase family 2 protein [Devosiaceae bacterium]